MNFLTNDNFIKWRLFPTEELDLFWTDFIEAHPQYNEDFKLSIEKFKSVQLNKKELSQEKIDELLHSIIIDSSLKRKKKQYRWMAAACLAILVFSTSLLFNLKNDSKIDVKTNTIIGETLPSKNIQFITGDRTFQIKENAEIELSSEGQASIKEESKNEKAKVELATEINR